MTLNDCVTKFCAAGTCGIDRDIAVKYFTDKSLIYHGKGNNVFRLLRYTHKRNRVLKVEISEADAKFLIGELGLVEVPSGFFNSSDYVMKHI